MMMTFNLVVALGLLVFVRANTLTEENFECKKQGRFEDSSDCGFYFECIPDDFGTLTAYRRSCYGQAFNPRTHSCTNPSKVKGCKIREGRHHLSLMKYNNFCFNSSDNFICADCETSLMCSDGIAYPTKCENHLRCKTGVDNFEGAICHPEYDEKCSCREDNTYYQDPFYNGTFFFCENKDSNPMFLNCPSEMYFDENTTSCKTEDGLPVCTKSGIFPYPDNCKKYYNCIYAIEGWTHSRHECSENMLLNVETGHCEDPCGWASNISECQIEGRFKDPKDCNQFFECVRSSSGDMLNMTRSCPPNFHWNDETKKCVKREEIKCKPETEGPLQYCQKDYDLICRLG